MHGTTFKQHQTSEVTLWSQRSGIAESIHASVENARRKDKLDRRFRRGQSYHYQGTLKHSINSISGFYEGAVMEEPMQDGWRGLHCSHTACHDGYIFQGVTGQLTRHTLDSCARARQSCCERDPTLADSFARITAGWSSGGQKSFKGYSDGTIMTLPLLRDFTKESGVCPRHDGKCKAEVGTERRSAMEVSRIRINVSGTAGTD
ncbi:hypothetical protein P389DRAFT_205654 [Cystobasidium minutum MCA 4210]|uniref:uncharacterized protein n=1 Tax=Cystobasidium minutum MCA 4210 TaxID=1397322 RepID=UPI0034CFFD36|eukprot:jgi/Rhomi1/205654/MIX6483_12_76